MNNNRRYVYLRGVEFKVFRTFKEMFEYAQDERHDGKYYISCPDITFKYDRNDIITFKSR